MIKALTFINYTDDALTVTLTDASPESGLLITNVTGLGPAKGQINATEIATSDGSVFNSARVESRNIVVTFRFTFSPMIEDSRQLTYKYFPLKKPVTVVIETDNRLLAAYGYVESNEPNIFSENEETQISIICPDPYLYDAKTGTNTTVFSGIEPMFEFAFDNNDPVTPLLEMGAMYSLRQQNITYEGDSDVGIIFRLHALGTVENIVLYNVDTNESMRIDTDKLALLTGAGFNNGDDIIINTNTGLKSAVLLRNGKTTNILNCISKDADWIRLYKGDNQLAYRAEVGTENIMLTLTNQIIYEGI